MEQNSENNFFRHIFLKYVTNFILNPATSTHKKTISTWILQYC